MHSYSTAKRLLAIVNPIAGKGHSEGLKIELAELAKRTGFEIKIQLTQHRGDGQSLATQARSRGFDAVIACGGDGTLNEVINGLGVKGLPLLVIPRGTGNSLGREIRAPRNLLRYAKPLKEWRTFERDLGKLQNGRLFACFVGAGVEAETVRHFHDHRTTPISLFDFVWFQIRAARRALQASKKFQMNFSMDGSSLSSNKGWAFIANSPIFGSGFQLVPHATPQDGYLDLMTLNGSTNLWNVFIALILGKLRRTHWMNRVQFFKGKKVELNPSSEEKIPFEVDGEFGGYLPIKVEILSKALTLFQTS